MPVICDWYSRKNRIIGIRYIGKWTVEENVAANPIFNELIQSVNERFDMIVDALEAAYTFPTGTLWNWKQKIEALENNYPMLSLVVYVTSSDVHKAYFEDGFETSTAVRKHCRMANSIEEALEIIQQDRQCADV
jgi:hypothetical protein